MRTLSASTILAAMLAVAGSAAQDPPSFRSDVDLITIDVAAVDSSGRPVEGLRASDFTVKVDGESRRTVSAQLIRIDRGTSVTSLRPGDELISTNTAPQHARRVIVAVDQTLITPGLITPLLRTASLFVERLTPADYAAFIAFPEPGPRIDFTTDKAQVVKAMQGLVGQPSKMDFERFNISLSEAFTITGAEDIRNKAISQGVGPTMVRVMDRECQGLPADECRREIYNQSLIIAINARHEARISLDALESLLQDLVPLEGPKSMVVFSAGLVNEDPSLLEDVARLAVAARTTINVIAADRQLDPVRADASRQSAMPMTSQDRAFEMAGLELIADNTGGTLFRGIASGAGIFERLESELSAWYLVAVERESGDPDRQRIDVSVRRRGVTVRSNRRAVATAVNTARPPDELLSEALSSPFAIPGFPLRVSTFLQRDTEPGKYRVRLAAQIGLPGEPAGEFTVGYLLANERGGAVTTGGSRRTLSPAAGPNQPLHYDTALSVEPGVYTLRFGIVGPDGRRGTVTHRLEVPELRADGLASSDLFVGNLPAGGEPLRPAVEPQIATSELAGYLELYLPDRDAERVTVTLEIAEGESSPALAARPLTLRAGDAPGTRVATGLVAVTVAPGHYLARASIRRDDEVIKTLVRPISVVRDPTIATARPAGRDVPLAPEVRQRTAAYVSGVVARLANIVAEEAFVLADSDRRVTSELLLVRYPGSVSDLIPYRDVSEVNGKPVPGRETRLLELFVKPTAHLRERARQIMLDGDEFVPTAFNPIFALAFLQSDFQSRFELTVAEAGSEWPAEVRTVTFVEVARPTLLRGGPFGDLDVPTRGTAWIEQGTGRVLQTELQVGTGRAAPAMVTRFGLDQRLQVTVPQTMRTRNPEGEAHYRNFRRFDVATDTTVPPGRQ